MHKKITTRTCATLVFAVIAILASIGIGNATTVPAACLPLTILPTYNGTVAVTGTFLLTGSGTMPVTATSTTTNAVYNFTGTILNATQFTFPYSNSLPSGAYTLAVNVTGHSLSYTGVVTLTPNYLVVFVPGISGMVPNFVLAGAPQTVVAIDGSNFENGAVAEWNGVALPTTYIDASHLTAVVPSSDMTTAGTNNITVVNPDSGVSNPAGTFIVDNWAPITTSMLPSSTLFGSSGFTLSVSGANLLPGSVIDWNGSALTTTYNSSTSLSATVPASDVASAGTASVTVSNPAPGGGTSAPALIFTITPNPAAGAMSPNSATAGDPDTNVLITGTGFEYGAVAQWNGAALTTTVLDSAHLEAIVPQADLVAAGTFNVTILNPDTGVSAPAAIFTVNNPAPIATSLSPSSILFGSPTFTMTVNGTGFVNGSVVYWNGAALPTTYVGSTSVTAIVSATLVANSGTASVSVTNPAPGGGTSTPDLTFTIAENPAVSSVTPTSAIVGQPDTVVAFSGAGFESGVIVEWNGNALATTHVDANDVTAIIPASDLASAGTNNLTLANPDGGVSAPATQFVVQNPSPVASSTSPSWVLFGSPSFTLTVTGAGFVSGSAINWNGTVLPTAFVNSTSLTATVPASDVANDGTANVTVSSPAPGGGTSSPALTFTVYGNPTISTVSPAAATVGDPDTTIALTGSGFENGATVQWNGVNLTTTFVDGSDLTAVIPQSDFAAASSDIITVLNPDAGISTPGAAFTINNPVPTASSLSPTTAAYGSPAFTMTVTGANFVPGAVVNWAGAPLATTYVNSTTVTAVVPGAAIASSGSINVSVTNPAPGGGTSTPDLTFTINGNPVPIVAGIAPQTVNAGATSVTITVTGANLVSGSEIVLGGSALNTTYVNSTTLTAQIPDSDISNAGMLPVTILNPAPDGGTATPGLTLTVMSVPTIASLSPNKSPYRGPQLTITITGTGFISGARVTFDGERLVDTYASATTIYAVIPAQCLVNAGVAAIVVLNPDGGVSNSASFTVSNAPPAIASLSPNSAPAGGPQVTVTIIGSGFQSGARVTFDSMHVASTYVSAAKITAVLPAQYLQNPGAALILVINPDGTTSNIGAFTVNSPAMSITSISPSQAPVGSPQLTVTVTGTGFQDGARSTFDGQQLAVTYLNSTHLQVLVPAQYMANAGVAGIVVKNNGSSSNSMPFTVTPTTLSITSLSPNSAPKGGAAVTITINGAGFVSGARATFDGMHITSTYVSATKMTAVIPAQYLANSGAAKVIVINPNNAAASPATFTVASN